MSIVFSKKFYRLQSIKDVDGWTAADERDIDAICEIFDGIKYNKNSDNDVKLVMQKKYSELRNPTPYKVVLSCEFWNALGGLISTMSLSSEGRSWPRKMCYMIWASIKSFEWRDQSIQCT